MSRRVLLGAHDLLEQITWIGEVLIVVGLYHFNLIWYLQKNETKSVVLDRHLACDKY